MYFKLLQFKRCFEFLTIFLRINLKKYFYIIWGDIENTLN